MLAVFLDGRLSFFSSRERNEETPHSVGRSGVETRLGDR